jgi:hypothetical protein
MCIQADPIKFFETLQTEFPEDPMVPFLAALTQVSIENNLALVVVTGSRFVPMLISINILKHVL